MTPSQQPSSQCQEIKLLCIGDWILRLHTHQRRYQTATAKGQCDPSSCGAGADRMFHTILQHFTWPSLRTQVENLVKHCNTCQHYKA
jgi:hypothetical protein